MSIVPVPPWRATLTTAVEQLPELAIASVMLDAGMHTHPLVGAFSAVPLGLAVSRLRLTHHYASEAVHLAAVGLNRDLRQATATRSSITVTAVRTDARPAQHLDPATDSTEVSR